MLIIIEKPNITFASEFLITNIQSGAKTVFIQDVNSVDFSQSVKAGISIQAIFPKVLGLSLTHKATTDDFFNVIDNDKEVIESYTSKINDTAIQYFKLSCKIFSFLESFGYVNNFLNNIYISYTDEAYKVSAKAKHDIVYVPYESEKEAVEFKKNSELVFGEYFNDVRIGWFAKDSYRIGFFRFSGQKPYSLTANNLQVSQYLLNSKFEAYGLSFEYVPIYNNDKLQIKTVDLQIGKGNIKLLEEIELKDYTDSLFYFSLDIELLYNLYKNIALSTRTKYRNFQLLD